MKSGKWTLLLVMQLWLHGFCPASTYTVTNTKDDGSANSLRWAIQQANSHAGPDEIQFSIPTTDAGFNGQYWTIAPGSPLPELSAPATGINGSSQAVNVGDYNPGGPEILLDGRSAGSSVAGLQITSAGNTINGLSICGFSHCGIFLFGSGASSNMITFCFLGLAPDGVTAISNHVGMVLSIGAGQNTIGSAGGPERNCISGNETHGIEIYQAHDNFILHNLIGTDPTGTFAVGNAYAGIWITGASTGNVISAENLISGNGLYGILIDEAGTRGNKAEHNLIGTDISGLNRIGNNTVGVMIGGKACANVIEERNIISGNAYGLIITDAGTDSNRVSGNWIGLDATGMDTLPNYLHGLRIENGARHNTVGGLSAELGNIISGNGWSGMCTAGDSTAYNTFAFNWCGLDASGNKDLGNVFYGAHFGGLRNRFVRNVFCGNLFGLVMSGYSEKCLLQQNLIGLAPDGNTVIPNDEGGARLQDIAYRDTLCDNQIIGNTGWGVELKGPQARKITLSQNSITLNESGGILLTDGANEGVAPPIIETADPGTGRVFGYASPLNIVELFEDAGNQGKTFLGQVNADAGGTWEWTGGFSGPNVTATATDAEGNTTAFSNPKAVPTAVQQADAVVAGRFGLQPNHPNPFNASTMLQFEIPHSSGIELCVHDMLGQKVRTLANRHFEAGMHSVPWDGLDDAGKTAAAGLYVCILKSGGRADVKKLLFLK